MEVFKNRMVIFSVIFLPLMMAALPLGILYTTRDSVSASAGGTETLPPEMTASVCSPGMSSAECFQVFLISEFMMMFMLVPVIIPANIAAYSIVGEKTNRSLEPLLATPITTLELLAGKCLASVIPAALATYGAFGIFAAGAWILTSSPTILTALMDPRWLIAIFLGGPLLAVLAVTFGLMVSSRVNDVRVAEQLSVLVILPILAGFFGQIAGLFVLNRELILIVAFVLAVVDAFMLYLAVQTFQRETILTRWK
jgi:ABC-2 type transport system permease protein